MVQLWKIARYCIKEYTVLNSQLHKMSRMTDLSKRLYTSQTSVELNANKSMLYRHLYAKIKSCGPISVADYMKETLTHPIAGYYMTKDVFGQKGDFITSPEITQLFGEMIAVWIIYEWKKISKDRFQLIELGPGRGSLMQDILRTFKKLGISELVSVHLVEISPALSAIQAKNLCRTVEDINLTANKENLPAYYRTGITQDGVKVFWYYSIQDIPKEFSVFIAHEFFDALPIHKFQKTDKGWREVLVDIIEGTDEEKFRYVTAVTPATAMYVPRDDKRDHVEVSPQTMTITEYMSSFLMMYGGFALIADYGHDGEKTDTFRAFRQHKQQDPLLNPGTADLTADVDFAMIKKIAKADEKLITFGPINQNKFLKNLGIDTRLQMLLHGATKEQSEQLKSGYRMIMDDDKMGKCFKLLSLFPFVLKRYFEKRPVAGFDVVTKHSNES